MSDSDTRGDTHARPLGHRPVPAKLAPQRGVPQELGRKDACDPHYQAGYFYWLPQEMPAPQRRDKDNHPFNHQQQYAQPSDQLAYHFSVLHKQTDVAEEEAQRHVVAAGE